MTSAGTSASLKVGNAAADSSASPTNRRARVFRGSAWTIGAFGLGQVLRVAGNVVIARLLFPEAFGLMSLVMTFVMGLQLVSDLGIAPSLIRSPRGHLEEFRSTAWTVGLLRGVVLWLVATLLAWPLSLFYDPRILYMLPVVGLSAVIGGLGSTAILVLSREMRLAKVMMLELASSATGIVTMCAWAWAWPSVWALVGGSLVGAAVRAGGSWTLIPGYRDRLAWDRESLKDLLHFGRWVLVSSLLTFFAAQADKLLLGKLLTMEEFGVYAMALSLASMPRELVIKLTQSVQFPFLAEIARDPQAALSRSLPTSRRTLLLAALLGALGIGLGSQAFFSLLYDVRYADAVGIVQLSAIPVFVMMLTATADRALLALGNSRGLAMVNAVRLCVSVPVCIGAYLLAGLPGFILGIAAGGLAGHCVVLWSLRRHCGVLLRQDAGFTLAFAAMLGGPLLIARVAPVLGTWRRVDLTLLSLAMVVLVPLGLYTLREIRDSLLRNGRPADLAGAPAEASDLAA